jgi:hypothetical protein
MCLLCLCFVLSFLYVAALGRADHSSKESYQLSVGFIIWDVILNGNRPESLIRRGRRRRRRRRRRRAILFSEITFTLLPFHIPSILDSISYLIPSSKVVLKLFCAFTWIANDDVMIKILLVTSDTSPSRSGSAVMNTSEQPMVRLSNQNLNHHRETGEVFGKKKMERVTHKWLSPKEDLDTS